jgi:catechol 2,3-dioxygenase-like lactoylglutathione lyase family enzyme
VSLDGKRIVIVGAHAIVYAEHADATRAFLRDVLDMEHVDAGDGWLIFRLPPAEVGVHPTDAEASGRHELYLVCDDIQATVRDLQEKGVEFVADVSDEGWGLLTAMQIPGGGTMGLYEPRHPTAFVQAETTDTN